MLSKPENKTWLRRLVEASGQRSHCRARALSSAISANGQGCFSPHLVALSTGWGDDKSVCGWTADSSDSAA